MCGRARGRREFNTYLTQTERRECSNRESELAVELPISLQSNCQPTLRSQEDTIARMQ